MTTKGENLPLEMVMRMSDGESPIKVWREYRRLTVRDLAGMARISPTLLTEFENGMTSGFGILVTLARALSIDDPFELWPWSPMGSDLAKLDATTDEDIARQMIEDDSPELTEFNPIEEVKDA